MEKKRVVVTGGTGFVGQKLCAELAKTYEVAILARKKREQLPYRFFEWNTESIAPAEALEGAHAVIHLAGEPIAARRWSAEVKKRIFDSRVTGTQNLRLGIERCGKKPGVLLGTSAVGFYGSRGNETLTEASAPGSDFLAQVCQAWEQAYLPCTARTVLFRFGMVLGAGGALEKMLPPFRLGLGAALGDGQQWMSWIHIDDLVRMFLFTLEKEEVHGVWNATAPEPVTNLEFTKKLGQALNRPAFVKAPAFALKLALGEMAEVLLASQKALPVMARKEGFSFQFETLDSALRDVLAHWPR